MTLTECEWWSLGCCWWAMTQELWSCSPLGLRCRDSHQDTLSGLCLSSRHFLHLGPGAGARSPGWGWRRPGPWRTPRERSSLWWWRGGSAMCYGRSGLLGLIAKNNHSRNEAVAGCWHLSLQKFTLCSWRNHLIWDWNIMVLALKIVNKWEEKFSQCHNLVYQYIILCLIAKTIKQKSARQRDKISNPDLSFNNLTYFFLVSSSIDNDNFDISYLLYFPRDKINQRKNQPVSS